MKKKLIVAAVLVVLFSIGGSLNAEAGRGCRRGYYRPYRAYYAPRPVYYAPPPPVVVVGPRWGYRPHYNRGWGYSYGYRHRGYGRRW